jgi:hypothetical protein
MKSGNTQFSVAVTFSIIVAASTVALAGDVDVTGSDDIVLEVVNTYNGSSHKYAVWGENANRAGYGYGGRFSGGKIGVRGEALVSGSGDRYGVVGRAESGSGYNYGVYGSAEGNYSRGVYGAASGSNAYAGYFDGNVQVNGNITRTGSCTSDENLKDEITDVEGSLDQIMELRPKSFRYRTEEYPRLHLPSGYRVGLIAQDVEQVMPDLVSEVPMPDDPEGPDDEGDLSKNSTQNGKLKSFLVMDYEGLIPVLVGAIQEQQRQIAELQNQNNGCRCK